MRLVLQRVSRASVTVDGAVVGEIGRGLLALVGVAETDDAALAQRLAAKTAEMRIFSDAEGKFNLSLLDVGGEALVVSQFTLHADTRKGRRPSFLGAARPEVAEPIVLDYGRGLEELGVRVARGRFGQHMRVELVNDGPVTIIIDSEELDRLRQ
jgi:D-tyrosyl-tRNA(Tyr) deacylase